MFSFDADAFAGILDGMHRLEAQASAQEDRAEAILAAAETGERLAMGPLAQPREVSEACVDRFERSAAAQLRRYEVAVASARRLCVAAHEHRIAATELAAALGTGRDDSAPSLDGGRRPRRAVLVVDDHDDSRELLAAALHNVGFTVRTARNGVEAIIAAYEMRPAVIVMDVTMPVLDGVEATRLIKTIDAVRDARVIAHTALPLPRGPVVASLFAAVLQKPVPLEVLTETVRRCLDA
jgi:CheY-like chemotaxis protein